MASNLFYTPEEVVYDRGEKGQKKIGNTIISTPGKPLKRDSEYQRRKKRNKFRRRAAIEPVIGHLKTDFRSDNYRMDSELPNGRKIITNQRIFSSNWLEFKKDDAKT